MKTARVLATFCGYYFVKLVKNSGFQPKFDQAAVQKVAKTRCFF